MARCWFNCILIKIQQHSECSFRKCRIIFQCKLLKKDIFTRSPSNCFENKAESEKSGLYLLHQYSTFSDKWFTKKSKLDISWCPKIPICICSARQTLNIISRQQHVERIYMSGSPQSSLQRLISLPKTAYDKILQNLAYGLHLPK